MQLLLRRTFGRCRIRLITIADRLFFRWFRKKKKQRMPAPEHPRRIQFQLPFEIPPLHDRRPTRCLVCPPRATHLAESWEIDILPEVRFCMLECLERACGQVGLVAQAVSMDPYSPNRRLVAVERSEEKQKHQS